MEKASETKPLFDCLYLKPTDDKGFRSLADFQRSDDAKNPRVENEQQNWINDEQSGHIDSRDKRAIAEKTQSLTIVMEKKSY